MFSHTKSEQKKSTKSKSIKTYLDVIKLREIIKHVLGELGANMKLKYVFLKQEEKINNMKFKFLFLQK